MIVVIIKGTRWKRSMVHITLVCILKRQPGMNEVACHIYQ